MSKVIIIEVWKKAREYNEKEINKIKDKYNVKFIEFDEYWVKCMFKDSKVEFTIPYDENFEDYNLTGNALEFAQKHFEICDKSFSIVTEELEEEGFEEDLTDELFSWWKKDGITYSIPHYVKDEKDIEVLDAEQSTGEKGK